MVWRLHILKRSQKCQVCDVRKMGYFFNVFQNIMIMKMQIYIVNFSSFQKQIFFDLFEPKNERIFFLISAHSQKMGRIKKMKALSYM